MQVPVLTMGKLIILQRLKIPSANDRLCCTISVSLKNIKSTQEIYCSSVICTHITKSQMNRINRSLKVTETNGFNSCFVLDNKLLLLFCQHDLY